MFLTPFEQRSQLCPLTNLLSIHRKHPLGEHVHRIGEQPEALPGSFCNKTGIFITALFPKAPGLLNALRSEKALEAVLLQRHI